MDFSIFTWRHLPTLHHRRFNRISNARRQCPIANPLISRWDLINITFSQSFAVQVKKCVFYLRACFFQEIILHHCGILTMSCCSFSDKPKKIKRRPNGCCLCDTLGHLMSLPCATNLNKPRHMLIWPRRLHINYFLTCENSIVWCLSLLWLSSWIVCYVHTFHFVLQCALDFEGLSGLNANVCLIA